MAVLRQLTDAETYRPCDWDLGLDAEGRSYWLELFRWHFDAVVRPILVEEHPELPAERLDALRSEYWSRLDDIERHPQRWTPLDVLRLTELRREYERRFGFDDPFRAIKQRENEAALELLPGLLSELDAATPDRQRDLLVQGLMAGNIFDLGSIATIKRHRDGETAFRQTRASQPARPWFQDDVDAWWRRWQRQAAYTHAIVFVDNAGSDILLGIVPLARWMLARGTRVTLAANSEAALNDITADELMPLVERVGALDGAIGQALVRHRLRVSATGSQVPLLDLMRLDEDFVARTADADLVILHGMGRSVESNRRARFACDALWSAVLKDERVAAHVGGKLYDCIFRFSPAAR
jgi:uncharacterized protein with ATP-grasp and redox domains